MKLNSLGRDWRRYTFFIKEFNEKYSYEVVYKDLNRAFGEHYRLEESQIIPKTGNKELKGSTLLSPYDKEATYRNKNREGSKGYLISVMLQPTDRNQDSGLALV